MARLVCLKDGLTLAANDEGWYGNNKPVIKTGVQLYHYHNDHLGTPNELTDQQGDVVWYADYEAWGNTATVEWKAQRIDNIVVSEEHLQPIRFQGQSFDTETGLHYNRFRYFDPDLGMFTTRDPIGLMGGTNVFQYAPNPTGWIDPFGLNKVGDVGIHKDLKKVGGGFQSHHLNQDAAFRDVIPHSQGATVLVTGNAFKDVGSSHYEAHKSMEGFWDQYRKGGAQFGKRPTNLQYTKALANSLRAANLSAQQVTTAVRAAVRNRVEYGLLGGNRVPRIPGRINQRKC